MSFRSYLPRQALPSAFHSTRGNQISATYPGQQAQQNHRHPIPSNPSPQLLAPIALLIPVQRLVTPPHNLPERKCILRVLVPPHRPVLGDSIHEPRIARHGDVPILVYPVAPVAVAYCDAIVNGGDSLDIAG